MDVLFFSSEDLKPLDNCLALTLGGHSKNHWKIRLRKGSSNLTQNVKAEKTGTTNVTRGNFEYVQEFFLPSRKKSLFSEKVEN